MDVLTPDQRRKAMSRNRGKDTRPEVRFRKALYHAGLRYRKNYKKLPGTPDIALTRQKIAIFVDGDFWHAREHREHPGEQIVSNKEYWVRHLSRNVERDREIDDALTEQGWLVLRFWEFDLKHDLDACVDIVLEYAR